VWPYNIRELRAAVVLGLPESSFIRTRICENPLERRIGPHIASASQVRFADQGNCFGVL